MGKEKLAQRGAGLKPAPTTTVGGKGTGGGEGFTPILAFPREGGREGAGGRGGEVGFRVRAGGEGEGWVPACARKREGGRAGGWGVFMGELVARRIEGMGPRIREETGGWGAEGEGGVEGMGPPHARGNGLGRGRGMGCRVRVCTEGGHPHPSLPP